MQLELIQIEKTDEYYPAVRKILKAYMDEGYRIPCNCGCEVKADLRTTKTYFHEEAKDVVYTVPCKNCGNTYILRYNTERHALSTKVTVMDNG